MFTLLPNDGSDTASKSVIIVIGEDLNDILESTQNDISECCCEGDGVVEVGCWEHVFAWQDWLLPEVDKGLLGVDNVKLFLSENSDENFKDEGLFLVVVDLETGGIRRNIVDQR